jgi:hypothetical protein
VQLPPGGDNPRVELLDQLADVGLGVLLVDPSVQLGVVPAQQERLGADAGDVLTLDEGLEPPVRVVPGQSGDGLARQ